MWLFERWPWSCGAGPPTVAPQELFTTAVQLECETLFSFVWLEYQALFGLGT